MNCHKKGPAGAGPKVLLHEAGLDAGRHALLGQATTVPAPKLGRYRRTLPVDHGENRARQNVANRPLRVDLRHEGRDPLVGSNGLDHERCGVTVEVHRLDDRRLGVSPGPFIVAELSANHLGRLERALLLVEAAAEAGADAVKIQCWHPERMVLDPQATANGGPWHGRNLNELYQECRTPYGWIPSIADAARKRGITWFASVFDEPSLEMLEQNHCPIYKIASCEIVDLPLIKAAAKTWKPIIISTGMASEKEIHDACDAAIDGSAREPTLMKCTAAYPAPLSEMNLRTMTDMRKRYALPIGLSDHTIGDVAATVAVALGATVIEKHLTLSRAAGGPDAQFSSEPQEFASMVRAAHASAQALGGIHYGPTPQEMSTYALRRSLHYADRLLAGAPIAAHNLTTARPATGLLPSLLPSLIGRKLKRAVEQGQPVRTEDFHA